MGRGRFRSGVYSAANILLAGLYFFFFLNRPASVPLQCERPLRILGFLMWRWRRSLNICIADATTPPWITLPASQDFYSVCNYQHLTHSGKKKKKMKFSFYNFLIFGKKMAVFSLQREKRPSMMVLERSRRYLKTFVLYCKEFIKEMNVYGGVGVSFNVFSSSPEQVRHAQCVRWRSI